MSKMMRLKYTLVKLKIVVEIIENCQKIKMEEIIKKIKFISFDLATFCKHLFISIKKII